MTLSCRYQTSSLTSTQFRVLLNTPHPVLQPEIPPKHSFQIQKNILKRTLNSSDILKAAGTPHFLVFSSTQPISSPPTSCLPNLPNARSCIIQKNPSSWAVNKGALTFSSECRALTPQQPRSHWKQKKLDETSHRTWGAGELGRGVQHGVP